MKILQVMAGAPHGGAETAFVDMCAALHEAGVVIEAATRPNEERVGRLKAAGVKTHTLPFGGAFDFRTTSQMKSIIADFQPDIVQTWMSRAAQKTPGWKKGKRYLVVSRLGGYYKRSHFRSADYFTTITPDIRRHLMENGVAPDHVRHINNFADTEENVDPVSRATLATPEGAPLALALGRLHRAKAFDVLLRAAQDVPGLWLWIAGEGSERATLEALARELGIDGRVRFLGWRTDRAALFQACDLCVFPSRYEPFGTVFVQAWAQKKPLVVANADGPRQYVRDGEDGLIAPVEDAPALAAAIRRVIEDDTLAGKLAQAGYRRYQEEFTKEKTVADYLGFYRDILARESLRIIP